MRHAKRLSIFRLSFRLAGMMHQPALLTTSLDASQRGPWQTAEVARLSWTGEGLV